MLSVVAGVFVVRLLIWVFLVGIIIFLGNRLGFYPDYMSATFITVGLISLFPWIFNVAGLLEGDRRQGLAGLTLSFPWIGTSVAMFLVELNQSNQGSIGLVLGIGFGAGVVTAVVTQYFFLRQSILGCFRHINPVAIRSAAVIGGGVLFSQMPGQLTARVQIVLATSFSPV